MQPFDNWCSLKISMYTNELIKCSYSYNKQVETAKIDHLDTWHMYCKINNMSKIVNKRSLIILLGILVVLLIVSGTAYLEELQDLINYKAAELPSFNLKAFITKTQL